MRCMSGRVARKAPKTDSAPKKDQAPNPPPKVDEPPVLVEVAPPPDPVPMPPPYVHVVKGAQRSTVYGPWRPKQHKDELPCQKDKVAVKEDQARDIYLEFQAKNGAPPDYRPGPVEDETKARDLAIAVVQEARRRVPNGPYNNRGALPDEILSRAPHPLTEDGRADFMTYDGLGKLGEDAPGKFERLFRIGDDAMPEMPPEEPVRFMALMAATTAKLKGGVCEKFASLVMGILSVSAPPGTLACKVGWSGDHHFVVLRVGASQWWVADPWPHNSFVLPWDDCYFKREAIQLYTAMKVVTPVEQAFGVVFDAGQVEHSYQAAVRNLRYTKNDGVFTKNWTHRHNLRRQDDGGPVPETDHVQVPLDYDFQQHDNESTVILAAGPYDWG